MNLLSSKELAEHLGVTRGKLQRLVAEGLPHSRKGRALRFDADGDVAAWLIEMGYATQPSAVETEEEQIAVTRDDAARAIGVKTRTIADWLLEEDFPGRAGTTGRRDGYFPIEQIRKWRARRFGKSDEPTSDLAKARAENMSLRNLKLKQEILKEQGLLIDVGEVDRFMSRVVHGTITVLSQLPDRLIASLPGDLGEENRLVIRKQAEQTIRDSCRAIAELTRGDDDDREDDIEDEPEGSQ